MARDRAARPRGSAALPAPTPARRLLALVGLFAWVALGLGGAAAGETPSGELPRQQLLCRSLGSDPAQEYFLYVPSAGGQNSALFVAVHGDSRNSEAHATAFATYCETYGAVLVAPHFDEEKYRDYQRLGRAGLGGRADVVLESILGEVAAATGADTAKIYLFGFSGGAQFSHRFVLAHPRRVARAVVAAAGWYTFPDPGVLFPYGIGASPDLPGVRFDAEAFLRVPIAVVVGELDTGDKNLRHNEQVDAQQGLTRVERARNWVAAMRAAAAARGLAPQVTLEEVARMDHSFKRFAAEGRLGDKVFAFLFGPAPKGVPSAASVPDEELQPTGGAR